MNKKISVEKLFKGIQILESDIDFSKDVGGIQIHSKSVRDGDLYVALKGKLDGAEFCAEAMNNGAEFVVTEDENCRFPHVRVKDCREALSIMAGNYYGNIHKKLKLIGVVGTNGKTTTTYVISAILNGCGHKTAVVGTLGMKIGEKRCDAALTTPDPCELHSFFKEAYDSGVEYVVMEVSAHAIYYKKTAGLTFDVCVFTNVSQDHLDFFNTMEEYGNVKIGFFNKKNMKIAVVNADDEWGRKILGRKDVYSLSYGISNPSDVFAVNIEQIGKFSRFVVNAFDDIAEINVPLLGLFNVYNVLAALTAARAISLGLNPIAEQLTQVEEIEGRFNIIKSDITVIIDYAHTPDGLKNILESVRRLKGGRVITVFGCGGNRDKEKRPVMGKIVSEYSDFCVVTSDNPRYEEPMEIIRAIEKGFGPSYKDYTCIADRKDAICYAIRTAGKDDKVLIAGKGGENYIDIMGKKYPFSDKQIAEAALRRYRESE